MTRDLERTIGDLEERVRQLELTLRNVIEHLADPTGPEAMSPEDLRQAAANLLPEVQAQKS
jgi:hypothetical protein